MDYNGYCTEYINMIDKAAKSVPEYKPGDIVQHFKREGLSLTEKETNMYLYKIIGKSHHTETGEELMVYRALYKPYDICCRPYDMFISEVDHEKYPDVKQVYRFEKISYHELMKLYAATILKSSDIS